MTTIVPASVVRRALLTLTIAAAANTSQGVEPQAWYAGLSSDSTHVEVWRGAAWEAGGDEAGLSLRGGRRISRHFAVELAALQVNDLAWQEYFTPIPGLAGFYNNEVQFDTTALQASAMGVVPFGRAWEALFKGGLAYYRLSGEQTLANSYSNERLSQAVRDDGVGYVLGLGLAVTAAPSWRVRFEYQFFSIDGDNLGIGNGDDPTIDTLAIGVDYRFGNKNQR
jgi:opacity protein-like surface antigen